MPSLSGKESVGIIQFLMELDNPSSETVQAIQSAVEWLRESKIYGYRLTRIPDSISPTGFDKVLITDKDAPPLWARFYTIESNEPFFSDRDGKMYDDLSEISIERRNEYGWVGYWPQELLTKWYPVWQTRWVADDTILK